ncbi:hypothetical protein NE237_000599 [Protea cynaroides]|uniref:Response regulatory domain-containing protein n=1 Tax=Protea cynaroides TaxID=273540 RepID=A0A9Q0QXC1_9MAGN|nr:hypothetical protein NE237_000599 [Protea cynaroides]
MESCNCIPPQWPADEILMKYQFISDCFIALAYFSIPLQLIYFVKKSAIFPYRWVLVQFGAFIVLCGLTHLINLWTFNPYSRTVAVVMTIAKVLTAVVSCATALMLVRIIPDLLDVKTRELVFKNKVAELDVQKKKQASMIESFQMVKDSRSEINHQDRNSSGIGLGLAICKRYKVVFMDLGMPGTCGYEIARRIHERIPKRHEWLLIVALTGNIDKATKDNCLRVGMRGVLLKPISQEKLRCVLSKLLERGSLCESWKIIKE